MMVSYHLSPELPASVPGGDSFLLSLSTSEESPTLPAKGNNDGVFMG